MSAVGPETKKGSPGKSVMPRVSLLKGPNDRSLGIRVQAF